MPHVAMAVFMAVLAGCSSDEPAEESEGSGGSGAGTASQGGSGGSGGNAAAGASASGAGGGGGSATSGACLPALAHCSTDGECCNGAVCLNGLCRPTCEVRNDCGTLCCQEDAQAGRKICVEASLCEGTSDCSTEGTACTDRPCCDSMICVDSTVSGWVGCRPPCTSDGECVSGCCVPFANTTSGFCAEARFCACATLDEACGGTTQCCDGLACASTVQAGSFACRPICDVDADCVGGGCCVPLGTTGTKICQTGAGCP